ncbi:MAG: hypothetical protein KGJ77_09460 [Acidobacteriota bacterium]|nr:hypothetical protein [Acidobacteriota bacterium]
MTITEYLLNLFLVGLVVLQLRGRTLTVRNLVLPVVITLVVASQFLHGLPTAGNDLVLEVAGAVTGALLGAGAGLATSVRRSGRNAVAKAGAVAAVLWVVGIGGRVCFSFWVTHGGQPAVARFSVAHHVTSGAAWAGAFILMAMAEVALRTGVLFLKARRTGASIERGRALGAPATV